MATKSLRVSKKSHDFLRQVAEQQSISMADALDQIIDGWEQECFFAELDAAYLRLKRDPEAWGEEIEERAEWDSTLHDDLNDD